MSYSDFSFEELKKKFGIKVHENLRLFNGVEPCEVSELLMEQLNNDLSLALAIDTEKARSEFIIAPILSHYRRMSQGVLSLFSGIDFTVEKESGLNGICDFIISYSSEQLYLETPVVMLVEAKNDRIKNGIPQCIAEMIAAQKFNKRENNEISYIYGIVTTGSLWRFIKIDNTDVYIDKDEYHIKDVQMIMGILIDIMKKVK